MWFFLAQLIEDDALSDQLRPIWFLYLILFLLVLIDSLFEGLHHFLKLLHGQ